MLLLALAVLFRAAVAFPGRLKLIAGMAPGQCMCHALGIEHDRVGGNSVSGSGVPEPGWSLSRIHKLNESGSSHFSQTRS